MDIVTIYRRHSEGCPQAEDRYSRKCRCRLWFQFQREGVQVKVSAKTRSWETASKEARRIEVGGDVITEDISVRDAVTKYLSQLADPKRNQKKTSLGKPKRMLARLVEFCDSLDISLLRRITPMHMADWRCTWTFRSDSSSPRIHDAVCRAFFLWAFDFELIPRDPYAKLDKFAQIDPVTMPFTTEEMERIFSAVNEVEKFDATQRYNVRGLILLQRWSGLAITDALLLSRAALHKNNSLALRRVKTNEEVMTTVPQYAADHLRLMPNSHPGYFFWDGKKNPKTLLNYYSDMLRLVFDQAGISRDRSKGGNVLSHRFRDTFSVEFLISGKGMEDLSMILGHSNIATTQKHYAPWTPGRRDRLRKVSEESIALQKPVGMEATVN